MNEQLLQLFRGRIRNPRAWRTIYRAVHSYSPAALQNPFAVGELVDWIAAYLHIRITARERAAAIRWIVSQRLNPHNHRDRGRIAALLYS
ncbi:MAG: hypothetical protein OWT28_06110 [Firmicutes bacterium]|nr:hypothetical protein [Bacillota bacterium]